MGNWSDGTPVRILEITPSAPTGIEYLKNELSVSVFPNPSKGNLQFTVAGFEFKQLLNLEMYDALGRKALTCILNHQSSIINYQLSDGVYFYQLKNSSNEILRSGKLVVE
jgi:hypothetical protein